MVHGALSTNENSDNAIIHVLYYDHDNGKMHKERRPMHKSRGRVEVGVSLSLVLGVDVDVDVGRSNISAGTAVSASAQGPCPCLAFLGGVGVACCLLL
jgi:hypothetical protein